MAITRKFSSPPEQLPAESTAATLPNVSSSPPPAATFSSPAGISQADEDEPMLEAGFSNALNKTEQEVIDLTSVEHQTPSETASCSQPILNSLIKKVTILFATYTILMENNDPDSNATNDAYDAYILHGCK